MARSGVNFETFHIIPLETGRGCPYGCDFCTVTGFFGDSIRFRTNQSVVDEMLLIKARAKKENGRMAVFFVDDNFAINIKRTKSLLRAIIAAGAQLSWVGQISANLLRDEELVDLIAESGGKWIFIGMESIDPANLADVNKSFNKPGEYAAVLERLAKRNLYAITSFIFGLDNDTPGAAERTLEQIRTWPPGLPVFGQLTPFPATPLYARLEREGRVDASDALARFRTFPHGPQAAENDSGPGTRRGRPRLDRFLQSGHQPASHHEAEERTCPVSDQPSDRAPDFQGHLLPANEQMAMAQGHRAEPRVDFPPGKGILRLLVGPANGGKAGIRRAGSRSASALTLTPEFPASLQRLLRRARNLPPTDGATADHHQRRAAVCAGGGHSADGIESNA
jgi:hypothetical protein